MCSSDLHPEEEEGLEEVCLINTLVEKHCEKNLEESSNESLEMLEEGLPEPFDVLAIMSPWRRREEILPLFNKEDSQGAATEDPLKLVLKSLPVDLKYAYLEEMRNDAYLNSKIAKERSKKWHDQLVNKKNFTKGQRVLLYDSKLHLFPGRVLS